MERWEEILAYWFGTGEDAGRDRSPFWFGRGREVDGEIRAAFAGELERASEGRLREWTATARSRLALILLLDQFSRHIHRDSPAAYSQDPAAQQLSIEGIGRGLDRRLDTAERMFFYMPLMHAEDIDLQTRSVHCFRQLVEDAADEAERALAQGSLEHALAHRELIDEFGRFPWRNSVLGRANTQAETRYLAKRG